MGQTKRSDAILRDPVRRRLLRLLTAKGSNLRIASVAMGRNDACLQQFVYRGTPKVLAEDDREILAEHLGCRPELLKHGRSFRLSTRARRPPPSDAYSAPIGYSAVPEADVRMEPDAEAWNGELRETGEAWLFADSFIRHRLRADPGDLWMIEVDGDPMEPLLSSGDHILIDVSRTVPAPPGIFVIWDGIALVAKRIEHVPHSDPPRVVLKSLNPEYDSHERPATEVRVVDCVLWVSRRL
ncbi:MAG: S24 family peptidase [Gemmatimonadetes bacterium]|nr:S24 family peptidase [Candidatus Palauibacter rhopaloidicola]